MLVRCSNCFEQYDREYEICPYCGFIEGYPAAEPFYLNPGVILHGRYIVGMVVGYGGFGITYKAWDKRLQNVVAIKEYFPSGIVNRTPGKMNVAVYAKKRENEFNAGFERFIDEARNMAKFSSRNIVQVNEYFEENQTAYIVMEFLDGVKLSEYLKTRSLRIDEALSITQDVCEALKTIHAARIIHRDVSPENVIICKDGRVVLIDFGAARLSLEEDTLRTVIVKPGYAPPEQYEKVSKQGPWTDIYAVGASLYHMLTGIKPDESTNRKAGDALVPPAAINPAIPENISNTVMKSMALDYHFRFRTVDEFEKGIRQEIKVKSPGDDEKQRKRRRLATVLSSALLVIIAISAFLYFYDRQSKEGKLAPASITVWYELSGDDALDAAKQAAYASVFDAFNESYPNINITVEAYAKDDYAAKLQAAADAGDSPALFETTGLDAPLPDSAIDLGGVLAMLNVNDCYFLDSYDKYFPARNQMPLGFIVPAVYINTSLSDITGDSITPGAITTSSTRNQFLAGQADMLLSDTSDFFAVRAVLHQYKLLRIDSDSIGCTFGPLWSISSAPDNEEKAAERLLWFMLTDSGQDYLFLRGVSPEIPLSKADLDTYKGVYKEFETFFDNIDSYTFAPAG